MINQLPNKTSHGHDMISNTLLKSFGKRVLFPLSIIFNQSLCEGKFLDKKKIAEVIPLYKGKEKDCLVNYRPISLLMTMSKLLERVVYKQMIKFIEKNNLLYENQYGFCTKRSCDQLMIELVGRVLYAKNHDLHSAAVFLRYFKGI